MRKVWSRLQQSSYPNPVAPHGFVPEPPLTSEALAYSIPHQKSSFGHQTLFTFFSGTLDGRRARFFEGGPA